MAEGVQSSLVSMTGFGRGVCLDDGIEVVVEIRSLNHRHLDFQFRLPSAYFSFERDCRQILQSFFQRGRIDVFVQRRIVSAHVSGLQFQGVLFQSLYDQAKAAMQNLGMSGPSVNERIALTLIRKKEIFVETAVDDKQLEQEKLTLLDAMKQAANACILMREEEGRALSAVLRKNGEVLREIHKQLVERRDCVQGLLPQKLEATLTKFKDVVQVDPQRISQEIAILLERGDITEEVHRLMSHLEQFDTLLSNGEGGGRKIDFLLQEMGREVNTIGSKAQDSEMQHFVVSAKLEIERMREQAANVQ